MSLTTGTRLGPYEVLSPIGAGAMGEVYKGRDTRLDRFVAIKVMSEALVRDPDRRARFEREAKAVAALSHPNILAIFDVGLHDNTAYAVTELLDGETLRARLASFGARRAPTSPVAGFSGLPVRRATEIAVQILRGLAAAHDKGIVHRDLKPENVFLLNDGQVKILDFGLAHQPSPSSDTIETAVAMTDPGVVVGTVGYMAPEQIRGQPVDGRTDLFALGAVLYEMLSGRRPFQGSTNADTMFAIVKDDPPELSVSRSDVPPMLERIVLHCLEKNPAERFQTARDVAFALETASGSATAVSMTVPAVSSRRRLRALTSAAVVVGALAAGVLLDRRLAGPAQPASPAFRLRSFQPQAIFNARFAPDGETIIYSSAADGAVPSLFVLRADTNQAQPIGLPATHLLSVSSTGELAVLTDAEYLQHRLFAGTLARMPLGGSPRPITDDVREADWSPDGTTLAIIRDLGTKDRLEFPIGTVLYEAAAYLSDLRVSPDGRRIAFFEHPNYRFDDTGLLKIVDRDRNVITLSGLFNGIEGLAWQPDGAAVLFSGAHLAKVPDGQPWWHYQIRVAGVSDGSQPHVALESPGGLIVHDVSRTGHWLAIRDDFRTGIRALLADQPNEREFSWLDNSLRSTVSRDGRWLAFDDDGATVKYGDGAVLLRNADGSPPVVLGEGNNYGLSPDGGWVLTNTATSQLVLYPTGIGNAVRLNRGPLERILRASWFPDGQNVLVCGTEPHRTARCYRQNIKTGGLVPVTPDGVVAGLVRPDGQVVIGMSANHVWQLYPLNGGAPQAVANVGVGDTVAAWADDGRSVFVQRGSRFPLRIERLDLASGRATAIHTLAPEDRAGLLKAMEVSVTGDGRWYAYDYTRRVSTMFVVSGLRR
jgi:tRNA A-37 threonylcarbamoyl transferase component Bud32